MSGQRGVVYELVKMARLVLCLGLASSGLFALVLFTAKVSVGADELERANAKLSRANHQLRVALEQCQAGEDKAAK